MPSGVAFSFDSAFNDGSAELIASGFISALDAEFANSAKKRAMQARFARKGMPRVLLIPARP
jgi:hypothetical protein